MEHQRLEMVDQKQHSSASVARETKKVGRSRWSKHEDAMLKELLAAVGNNTKKCNWRQIAMHFERRTAKQCNDHWRSLLGEANRKKWDSLEDLKLLTLVNFFGINWRIVTERMPDRTRN